MRVKIRVLTYLFHFAVVILTNWTGFGVKVRVEG